MLLYKPELDLRLIALANLILRLRRSVHTNEVSSASSSKLAQISFQTESWRVNGIQRFSTWDAQILTQINIHINPRKRILLYTCQLDSRSSDTTPPSHKPGTNFCTQIIIYCTQNPARSFYVHGCGVSQRGSEDLFIKVSDPVLPQYTCQHPTGKLDLWRLVSCWHDSAANPT